MFDIETIAKKSVRLMAPYETPPLREAEAKLNQNESPLDIPGELKIKIAKSIRTTPLNRYFDGGSLQLCEAIARKYGVRAENVIVGAGIDELLYYLVLAFVEPGDRIVRPVPSFSMYEICARVSNAIDTPIMLDESFELNGEFVAAATNAKITFICTPNNPTGNSIDRARIKEILTTTSGIVCIDEAYAEFAKENCLGLLSYPNVIIMRTFSKLYSGAALRLGYAVADARIIEYMNRVRLPWNISAVSQAAGEILIQNDRLFEQRKKRILKNRDQLLKDLQKIVSVYPTDSNFILFKVDNSKKIFDTLLERGVLVRDVSNAPGLKGCLRVTVGTANENKKFISLLRAVLSNQKPDALIFDIDGVLVDVSQSYREAIKRTVEKETGRMPTDGEIEAVKQKPFSNNDWAVTYALATGFKGDLSTIDRTSALFIKLRNNFQSAYRLFRDKEPLLIERALISEFQKRAIKIGFVTSRPRTEALYALGRIGGVDPDFVVAQEDCDEEKPSPKPIQALLLRMQAKNPLYIGDTINDKLAAERARISYEPVDATQNVNDILRRLLK